MVGVPSALHLAAGLLAVAASAGMAAALFFGALERPDGRGRSGGGEGEEQTDITRILGVLGAVAYGAGHVILGAGLAPPQVSLWVQIAGLAAMSLGAGPTKRMVSASAPLVVPLAPGPTAYSAAALAVMAAARLGSAGRSSALAVLGMLTFAGGHLLQPTNSLFADIAFLGGGLLWAAWLWMAASRRVIARILAAVVVSLVGLSVVLSGVLSTVGTNELTNDELTRLGRVGRTMSDEVQAWPAEALSTAGAIAIAPSALLGQPLSESEAANLYRVGFASQDFFIVQAASGQVLTAHPPDLGGSVELSLTGESRVIALLRDGVAGDQVGGLISSGGRIVAFGAVPLVPSTALVEDPPAGILLTGRIFDEVWAERRASAADVGVVGVVGGTPSVVTSTVSASASDVVAGLEGRSAGAVTADGVSLLAASTPIVDPDSGEELGAIITTSTPAALASLEALQAQRLFLVSIAGMVLAVALATLVTARVVRPITRLTDAARRIGAGDLDTRARIDSKDELGVLGGTFDTMVESLVSQQGELSSAARVQSRLRGRLESLTASMGDGLIATDIDGTVIQFNPLAEQLTGLPALRAIGAKLGDILGDRVSGIDAESAVPALGDIGELGLDGMPRDTSAAARLHLRQRNGQVCSIAATASPVRDDAGAVVGRVFVLRDIGREVEVERMKTEFLANVSHELRTPITPIKGYADVLSRRELDPESTRRFATEILTSTKRLERIVSMIVDFAGLDSGRVTLKPQKVDLGTLVGDVIEDWRQRHPSRDFGNHLNGGLPPVEADPAYLRKVLDELLDNAVKFSPDGEPIDVTAAASEEEVRLSVVDRGVGILEEEANALFTDFKQLDGTETRHYGGLGLGLGLVKRILEGSRARIEVDSEVGVGSSFSLLLPAGGPIPPPPLPSPPLRSGRVPPPPV